MSYHKIPNLYRDQTILLFKECYCLEKIHGTFSSISFDGKDLRFFSGGEKYENFIKLFNQDELLQKFKEFYNGHNIIVFGEAYGGCLFYNTPILLADNTKKTIGEIVNNKLNIEVLSYNIDINRLESKKITNWYRQKNKNNWKTIYFDRRLRGGRSTKLIVTDNHIFYTYNNGYIIGKLCKNLKIGDEVFIPHDKLSFIQEDVLRGSLLGDGSITHSNKTKSYMFSFSHSLKQKEYFDYKKLLLNSIVKHIEEYTSGFGAKCIKCQTKSLPDIRNIYNELYQNNKKNITLDYLDKLTPLGLSIWYMDDGSLSINNNGSHRNTSILHTQGFKEDQVDIIVSWFNKKGLFCRKEKSQKKYWLVKFTPDGTEKFQYIISPYIIKEMQYKLNKEFQRKPFIFNHKQSNLGLIKTTISKIEDGNPHQQPCYNERFDIEVEDNHNFFANNILVHNSQQGMSHTYGKDLKFVAFEVKIGDYWLSVENAHQVVTRLGLEFVHYVRVPTDISLLDKEMQRDSVQAIRNGMGEGHPSEGIVIRPLMEFTLSDGSRVIAKHKKPEFRETTSVKKVVDPSQLEILTKAKDVALEWVVAERLRHVADAIQKEIQTENISFFIKGMIEDIKQEGEKEIVWSKEVEKEIGRQTALLIKTLCQERLRA